VIGVRSGIAEQITLPPHISPWASFSGYFV
jgi:hypothetical protein